MTTEIDLILPIGITEEEDEALRSIYGEDYSKEFSDLITSDFIDQFEDYRKLCGFIEDKMGQMVYLRMYRNTGLLNLPVVPAYGLFVYAGDDPVCPTEIRLVRIYHVQSFTLKKDVVWRNPEIACCHDYYNSVLRS